MRKLRQIVEIKKERDPDTASKVMARANKINKTEFKNYYSYIHSIDHETGDLKDPELAHDQTSSEYNQIPTRRQIGVEHTENAKYFDHKDIKVEKVPMHRVSTSQETVNHAVISQMLHGVWNDNFSQDVQTNPAHAIRINHFHGPNDHEYVIGDGNHRTERDRYKGLKHIKVKVVGEVDKK